MNEYMEALRMLLDVRQQICLTQRGIWNPGDMNQKQARLIATELDCAEPIYLAHWVEQVVIDTSFTVPGKMSIAQETLPCPVGFAPIKQAFPYNGDDDHTMRLRWLLWGPPFSVQQVRSDAGVMLISLWENATNPELKNFGIDCILFGSRLDDFSALTSLMPEKEKEFPAVLPTRKLAYALWSFMNERKATTIRRCGVDRALRKQVERTGWEQQPLIQVVEMRVPESLPQSCGGEGPEIDWSCRWRVREHKRRITDKSGRRREIIVKSYVKGPKDKPLKNAVKLFAVVK